MVRLSHRWGRGTRSALGPFVVRTDAKQRGCAPDFDRRAPQGSCKSGEPGTTCFRRVCRRQCPPARRSRPVSRLSFGRFFWRFFLSRLPKEAVVFAEKRVSLCRAYLPTPSKCLTRHLFCVGRDKKEEKRKEEEEREEKKEEKEEKEEKKKKKRKKRKRKKRRREEEKGGKKERREGERRKERECG